AIVRSVATEAEKVDGVAPLGEQVLLSLAAEDPRLVHLLLMELFREEESADGVIFGYAQVDQRTTPASAELVVHPSIRGMGAGGALLRAVRSYDPDVRVWAHGNL